MKRLLCLLLIGTFILSGCAGRKTYRLKSEPRTSGRRKNLTELKEQIKVKNYIHTIDPETYTSRLKRETDFSNDSFTELKNFLVS